MFPAPSTSTAHVVRTLDGWLAVTSIRPLAFYMDPGSAFVLAELGKAIRHRRILRVHAPAQAHSSVGKVEAANRIIQDVLKRREVLPET